MSSAKNRLGIYFFYDTQGKVGSYVKYILSRLSSHVSRLVVVCNGYITKDDKNDLKSISSDIVMINDCWLNALGYREGIKYIGWDEIEKYDEMILLDHSIYGPFFDFNEIFESMKDTEIDFWGITEHQEVLNLSLPGIGVCDIPSHIQGYFIAFKNKIIKNKVFRGLWDNLKVSTFEEMFCYHESAITKKLSDLGYKYQVYVPTTDLREYSYNAFIDVPHTLVEERKCPFVHKLVFTRAYEEVFSKSSGQYASRVFDYIKNKTQYNSDMIWEDLIRTINQLLLKRNLHLNYILPDNCIVEKSKTTSKLALMIHIYFKDLVQYCFEYAKSMPKYTHVYITVMSNETKDEVEKVFQHLHCEKLEIILMPNRGRDVGSILVALKEFIYRYDYVCFVHDKKSTQDKPLTVGSDFSFKCFENLLGSSALVENIINTFEQNPRLGMLMPPPPLHGIYHTLMYNEWGGNYEKTVELAKTLGISVPIEFQYETISPLGTMFWFRPKALKTLVDYGWNYSDFPVEPNKTDGTILHAIERIYGLVVQHDGYYPAWVISSSYMQIELTNLNFMLKSSYKLHNRTSLTGKEVLKILTDYVRNKLGKYPRVQRLVSRMYKFIKGLYRMLPKKRKP